MTINAVTVPQWGLSMTEGELVQWDISPGDEVTVGQEIAEIETSKIAGPVEATVAGKVRRIIAEEGQILPVGALMAVLADDAHSEPEIDNFIAEFKLVDIADDADDESDRSKSNSISLGNMEISYQEITPASPDIGSVPVILIHGFGGDANNWLFNMGKIGETHRVLALDLPGHGLSAKNIRDEGSLKALAQYVGQFLQALDIAQAHLVGHSLGAAVAAQCALNQSSKIASLTLICPALVGRTVNGDFISGFIDSRTRKQLKPVLQLLFSNEQLVTREMVDDVLKYKRLDGVDKALRIIANRGLGGEDPAFESRDLAQLNMPMTILWGDDDKIISGNESHIFTCEQLREIVIENSGHMPHMENANAVNKILLAQF